MFTILNSVQIQRPSDWPTKFGHPHHNDFEYLEFMLEELELVLS